jgi:hypothetical protein
MDLKKTITSIFMVPALKINRERLSSNGFLNGYIKDSKLDVQYDSCIYLLFRPPNLERFQDFLDSEYEKNVGIVDDYDYENGFVVVVYKLNNKYEDDYKLIKEGKYSKTSEDFQKNFPKIIKIVKNGLHRDEVSLQYRIFRKTADIQEYWETKIGVDLDNDMEVWPTFEEEKETLDIDKIKEYVQQDNT